MSYIRWDITLILLARETCSSRDASPHAIRDDYPMISCSSTSLSDEKRRMPMPRGFTLLRHRAAYLIAIIFIFLAEATPLAIHFDGAHTLLAFLYATLSAVIGRFHRPPPLIFPERLRSPSRKNLRVLASDRPCPEVSATPRRSHTKEARCEC